jgi:hypothetical protein
MVHMQLYVDKVSYIYFMSIWLFHSSRSKNKFSPLTNVKIGQKLLIAIILKQTARMIKPTFIFLLNCQMIR